MRGHLKVFSRGNEMNYNQSAQHSTAQHSTAQHSTAQHSHSLCNAQKDVHSKKRKNQGVKSYETRKKA